MERCPSGRRSTPGKCVYLTVSRVRIPPSPPFCQAIRGFPANFLRCTLIYALYGTPSYLGIRVLDERFGDSLSLPRFITGEIEERLAVDVVEVE